MRGGWVQVGPTQWVDACEVAAVVWSRDNHCPVATLKSNGIVPMASFKSERLDIRGLDLGREELTEAAAILVREAQREAEIKGFELLEPMTATMDPDPATD